ncbi:MAG: type II toxin-antitoxin system HipA family toxin [bacterium]|nr:type II toxin-antitoxin system HipA family toxin [bacterium]
MTSELRVYYRDKLLGRLWLDEKRRFTFQYKQEWLDREDAIPLSLSLPLKPDIFADDLSRPFFGNLLPEADVRKAVARNLGISEGNDFSMLEAIGGECAGAVSVLPAGVTASDTGEYRALDDKELHEIVGSLTVRPFLAGREGVRLSLAGVQNKLPIYLKDNKIFLPMGSRPSSHIIKPPIRGFLATVENEAFSMALAKRLGLPVPDSDIYRGIDTLYVVERYDRVACSSGELVRLHQEDFCQAMGIPPDQKYESEGGPSLESCFSLLREHSIRPAADIKELINWVIFNYLIGNADAHGKNLALLFTDKGITLAPFYDLLSTKVYDDLADKLSMKIGGENRPDWIQLRHWERFAKSTSIKSRLIIDRLTHMSKIIVPIAMELAQEFVSRYGENNIVDKIVGVITKHSKNVELILNTNKTRE